jgi:hypothetical protein
VSRAFLAEHPRLNPLFDEDFSYSKHPDAGFGWEDVEMGYRCYLAGANIYFNSSAVSIHMSHPQAIEDGDKARRAMMNFRRLLDKHPQLPIVAPDWVVYTYRRLFRWLDEHYMGNIPDVSAVRECIEAAERIVPSRVSPDVLQW